MSFSSFSKMPTWENFLNYKVAEILSKGGTVVDIGGGLRISKNKGNKYNSGRFNSFSHFLDAPSLEFITTDVVSTYSPDEIQDLHRLTYGDETIDGLICLAVLEHVENPIQCFGELRRVMKKGGRILLYVPFLYRYHPEQGYYHDYFRFTRDSLEHYFKDFSDIIIVNCGGFLEAFVKISPFGSNELLKSIARFLDSSIPFLKRMAPNQTSGFVVFLKK